MSLYSAAEYNSIATATESSGSVGWFGAAKKVAAPPPPPPQPQKITVSATVQCAFQIQ